MDAITTGDHAGAAPAPAAAIECVRLTKAYGYHGEGPVALRDVTLSVPRGACFGLLGENGAGKSTLVKLLLGFLMPTTGTVRVLGHERVAEAHPRVGYVHERPIFEPRFSGRELLRYFAALAGLRGSVNHARCDELLERLELARVASRHVGGYSKGMLQRLAIAQALLTEPELLIADEPTSGLDAAGQYEVRQIIRALHAEGKTVLLCSHYLAEVQALCDTVGILRHGRLVRAGAVAELLRVGDSVEIVLDGGEPAAEVVRRLELGQLVREAEQDTLRIAAAEQQTVLAALVGAGIAVQSLNPRMQTLEEVFVRLTRHERQDTGSAGAAPDVSARGGRR
jgi:ABC-2 type transport system ATP-binding protein